MARGRPPGIDSMTACWLKTLSVAITVLVGGDACVGGELRPLSGTVAAATQDASTARLIESAQEGLKRGDLAGAAVQLEQALARDGGNRAARVLLSEVLLRLMRPDEAERQARLLREQFPGETQPTYLLALIAFQRGQPQQTRDLAALCLARGDDRPEVLKLLAFAEYLLQRPEEAEAHLRGALKQNPLDVEAHYHLGRQLYERKRYREAADAFQQVIRLRPEHYKARYYAGLLHEASNEAGRAKEEFLAAIQVIDRLKVRYPWPFTDLGKRLVNEGEFDRGLGWLYRAVRNDPASPQAHYEYAKALLRQGATAEVKRELLEAIRLDPGYSEAYYLLARYYTKAGEKQLAQETFAKFEEVKKNPTPSPYGLRRW